MSLELRSETHAGDSYVTDFAYLKVGVCQNNALRPEANSCAPRRTSSPSSQSQSVQQVPFNNSLHRTNMEPWRTQPLKSSLSLVEGQLSSTLSLRLVTSPI